MTKKYLYIVDHYVPFPTSEYGGIWNVIATNDEECFDLISAEDSANYNSIHYGDLRENIINSVRYLISEDIKSCVVEQFTT